MVLGAVLVLFYAAFFCSGMTFAEAREAGWLFPDAFPDRVDFYEVWTNRDPSAVEWDLLFSMPVAVGVVKAYFLGILTIVSNVYGVAQETAIDVDIDKDIRVHGFVSVVGGCLGCLPGANVMSFSCTAKSYDGNNSI